MSGGLYTIPAHRPFVDALAAGLLARMGDDPAALSDTLILLPTRRACRSLREAFLRQAEGRALLLPRMRPVGEVDEEEIVLTAAGGEEETILTDLLDLPPAAPETERLLQLARLVRRDRDGQAAQHDGVEPPSPEQALLLARELARLIDQVQTEGLSLDALESLVPEEHADHWAETIRFLRIIREHWPAYLESVGQTDPADRRAQLMAAQTAAWRATPPNHPVIAAGSTGSIPATADLIACVLDLPKGMVILPGLDRDLEAEAWPEVGRDDSHPQFGLARLLERLGQTRADVSDWPEGALPAPARTARVRLLAEAMRPAGVTDRWTALDGIGPEALTGVEWIDAPSPAAEAALAAQILRETLETPAKTAALVTPDRDLARRVAAHLSRWGIEVDDSAGTPLGQTAAGRFFLLTAEAAAARFAPVALLAVLKHPLSGLGEAPAALRRAVRRLEIVCLRGPSPAPGAAGLRAAIDAKADKRDDPGPALREQAHETVSRIDGALGPLETALNRDEASFEDILRAHMRSLEHLAETDREPGADRIWRGEDGEALADFLAELQPVASLLGTIRGSDYAPILATLMTGRMVRPRYGTHPRLSILGPLEARLQHADRMVLAGLNEGTWPPEPPEDPWMSRAMRRQFGLPAHERRIGLAAHDFTQACGAPEVVLLRTAKLGGQPTVPARWLERLATVLKRLGLDAALPENNGAAERRMAWQSALDSVPKRLPILAKPRPKPPVDARPRSLSATRIETLIRDPYQIFAERILRLRPLEDLEADLGAAEKGMMIHEALDRFVAQHPDSLPENAAEILIALGEEAFGPESLARPAVRAFWWPRFERIARWFVDQEAARRGGLSASHTEIRGKIEIAAPAGGFTLTAEADRIDRRTDGSYAILDYKTGGVPTKKDVETLSAPQLVLEAAILQGGGFGGIEPGPVAELAYWKLSGGEPAGSITVIDKIDPDTLAEAVMEKLKALIAAYDDPDTAYPPIPRPDMAPRFNDYAHLARIKEWSLGDGEVS